MRMCGAGAVMALALAVGLAGCAADRTVVQTTLGSPPFGSTASAVLAAGAEAELWRELLEPVRADVTDLAGALLASGLPAAGADSQPPSARAVHSPLGEAGTHAAASASVDDGWLRATTVHGLAVYEPRPGGQRWWHEAAIGLPLCAGAEAAAGGGVATPRLLITLVQEYVHDDGSSTELVATAVGAPWVPELTGDPVTGFDVDLRLTFSLALRGSDGHERVFGAGAPLDLRDVPFTADGLGRAVAEAIEDDGLQLHGDAELAPHAPGLAGALGAFAPAVGPVVALARDNGLHGDDDPCGEG
ncbi:hypothetical protein GCM10009851_39770 [Herbiconiux moechotypicola]|uniref:Lipoprotein n=2 Tax=Herbiconiux moechotypicola TaxID=637393 RepID=A0ABN3E7H0_9MICO